MELNSLSHIPNGIPNFAVLPIEGGTIYRGWHWNPCDETGNEFTAPHGAIDWLPEDDRTVYPVAAGFALGSFAFNGERTYNGPLRTVDGRGSGNHIGIFHPDVDVLTVYSHLDGIAHGIPWIDPIQTDTGWESGLTSQPPENWKMSALHRKLGQAIGTAGSSGLRGKQEHWSNPGSLNLPACDKVQLEVAFYRWHTARWVPFDPFGLGAQASAYTRDGILRLGTKHVWLLDDDGNPRCTK